MAKGLWSLRDKESVGTLGRSRWAWKVGSAFLLAIFPEQEVCSFRADVIK